MRVLIAATAAVCLGAVVPTPALGQNSIFGAVSGALNGNAEVGEVTRGRRAEGLAQGGHRSFTFEGREGERVTFELQSDAPGNVIMAIAPRASRWSLGAPTPVVVVSGRNQVATGILPRDGTYTVTLSETSLFPKAFNYTLDFSSTFDAPPATSPRAEVPAGGSGGVLYFDDDAPAAPPTAAPRRALAAPPPPSAPVVGTPATTPVPAHCRQQACWGGMDQNIGRSFSYFDITMGQTERISFYWVEPGRVLRLEKNGGGAFVHLDFTLDPATGAPLGYSILEDGGLATATPVAEGATRMTYRFRGDRFEEVLEERKNGRWRRWGPFGLQYGGSYRSDQAIAQANRERDEMFGTLMQGALVIGGAVVEAQAEVQVQQNELNRLAVAAAEETRQREAAAAAAVHARENERARQVAEAQYAQTRENDARRAASDQQAQARAEESRASREAARQREAEAQARQAEDARREREAQTEREAQARARAAEDRRLAAERERAARLAEQNALVDFPESVTLCERSGDQARFGNWRCTGSLQWTYVNFERDNWEAQLHMTCGGDAPMRDLGAAGLYRAFGCGFGIPRGGDGDVPARFGVFVGDRAIYRCRRSVSSCSQR